jgi:hypothetical protein
MADGTERNITDIKPGDYVVGYTTGSSKKRGRYQPTRVMAADQFGYQDIYEAVFADGTRIQCTEDHKWFTGRERNWYLPFTMDLHNGVSEVRQMYSQSICPDLRAASYLGGIFDGEGACSGKTIHISQSPEHNPEVCAEIERCMDVLGFDYGTHEREAHGMHKAGRTYYLKGGRDAKMRFILWCQPAKRQKMMDALVYVRRGSDKRKLVSWEKVGTEPVYNIQTETGNYIAYGCLTKNCQMLQNPIADTSQGFKREWVRYYERPYDADYDTFRRTNRYLIVDPANEKKKNSDYTAAAVIGLGADQNYYLLDFYRDRLNLKERAELVFHLQVVPDGIVTGKQSSTGWCA